MIQYPVEFIHSLRNRGAPYDDAMLYLLLHDLTDEEITEIEFAEFILGADLDKYLDPNKSYQIDTVTNRNQ